MSMTASQRPNRDWLWLILAIVLVGGITIPLWQIANPAESSAEYWKKWTPARVAKLLLGPEQIGCYLCFVWAGLMLLNRYREVLRQRQAFDLHLLPTEQGSRILPEDARPLSRKLDSATGQRPFILGKMIQMALTKFAISRKAPDVGEVVRNQAEVEQGRLVTSMGMISYLTWAIPAIGFLGTVRGLAGGLSNFRNVNPADREANRKLMESVTDQLGIAFDCTFVALALSVVLMYFLHLVQKAEEMLIIDCQQYCQEHLLLRLYDPQPEVAEAMNV
ncbi:MAG: MotA/TolQ/ExbB proton channel family protein [Planctomycetes bacterium]|nr:MotA/TolQ/ExbB proton channel family protein [Planctomycetota bacterium]